MTLTKHFLRIAGSLGLGLFLISIPGAPLLGITDDALGGPSIWSVNADINSCSVAGTLLPEIANAQSSLETELKLLKESSDTERALKKKLDPDRKKTVAERDRIAANIDSLRRARLSGGKFSSHFEAEPEKNEILKELGDDISGFNSLTRVFAPGSKLGQQPCPLLTKTEICNSVENDRKKYLGNISAVFGKRMQMVVELRSCVNTRIPFFFCKVLDITCPIGNFLAGTSASEAGAQFYQTFRDTLNEHKVATQGDVCLQTREHYTARLKDYRNKYLDKTQTPKEIEETHKKDLRDEEIAVFDRQLNPAAKLVADHKQAIGELKEEEARLRRKYSEQAQACNKKECAPIISIPQRDWQISDDPKMPDISASANTGDGGWTFKSSWKYNTVVCDYPAADKSMSGSKFNAITYVGGDALFGGKYSLKFETTCNNAKKSISESGLIGGTNPTPAAIKAEIERIGGANSGILKKIACQESSMRQFLIGTEQKCGGVKGMPYACNEKDIGIFQVRSVPTKEEHCEAAWNWKQNVYWGSKLLSEKECLIKDGNSVAGACYHNKSELMTLDDVAVNPELEKCIRNKKLADYIPEKLSDTPVPIIEYIDKIDTKDKRNKYISADYVKILQEVATNPNADVAALRAKAKGLNVSLRMLQLIDLVRNNYSVSVYDIEAIRRYNGGREYGYDLDSKSTKCEGAWRPHPERRIKMTKDEKDLDLGKSSYVISTLSQNPETCYK